MCARAHVRIRAGELHIRRAPQAHGRKTLIESRAFDRMHAENVLVLSFVMRAVLRVSSTTWRARHGDSDHGGALASVGGGAEGRDEHRWQRGHGAVRENIDGGHKVGRAQLSKRAMASRFSLKKRSGG